MSAFLSIIFAFAALALLLSALATFVAASIADAIMDRESRAASEISDPSDPSDKSDKSDSSTSQSEASR